MVIVEVCKPGRVGLIKGERVGDVECFEACGLKFDRTVER